MDGWRVDSYEDPADVLAVAGEYLASRPVEHNLVLRLLHARVARPEPGRYWVVSAEQGNVGGVVFQSPPDFKAALTPMTLSCAAIAAEVIALAGVDLPAVEGEAATVARFAGQWAETRQVGARPQGGVRLYRLDSVTAPSGVPGRLRRATDDDLDHLIGWFESFQVDVGHPAPGGPEAGPAAVRRRIADGQLWLWDHDGAVSFAAAGVAIGGVAGIGPVFTPLANRRRGYASACVAALAAGLVDQGVTPVLYTDLSNPTSNSIYRRIGFRAVNEGVRYDFIPPPI